MEPPALVMAAVTRPSVPDSWGSSTRRINENCALGAAMGSADVTHRGLPPPAPPAALSGRPPLPFSRPLSITVSRPLDTNSARELFLIDGNSLVYQAFFALPETIATSRGQPTNAIFGFASMLVKLMSEYGVKPTLVVWDAGTSGRDEIYDEYKAGRRERPDLLSEQWPYMHPLVDSFGYENVKVSGYEADDVIATLAERAATEGIDVTVVTGDRDLFQLVKPGVRVMA